MNSIIKFKNVSFKDNDDLILDDISFEINQGENISLIGQSNTGKTLIFKLISGLIKPTSGEIFVFDQNINNIKENKLFNIQKEIGLLFQNNALFDDLNCLDNVIFPLLKRNSSKKEAEIKAKNLLKDLKLENVESLYPDELSGGMKKRVALARMMIYTPKLYLFDDPTAGLDPVTAAKIYNIIKNSQNKENTSILISQDLENIFNITNRIIIISNSKIGFDGSQKDLKNITNKSVLEFIKR
jgi:phospholipid/cholesterol/gamma-HCH transport system ATP-binding protein